MTDQSNFYISIISSTNHHLNSSSSVAAGYRRPAPAPAPRPEYQPEYQSQYRTQYQRQYKPAPAPYRPQHYNPAPDRYSGPAESYSINYRRWKGEFPLRHHSRVSVYLFSLVVALTHIHRRKTTLLYIDFDLIYAFALVSVTISSILQTLN